MFYHFNAIRMGIIIGGSGSTGSSMFAQLLNRHSRIYCGPETALFSKLELYTGWEKHKSKIPGKGLRNGSWHRYNGIDLAETDFLWKEKEIQNLTEETNNLEAFANLFFTRVLDANHKDIWCEKTPSNAIAFQQINNRFESGSIIHCVRNPYDTISSLMNRGFNVYYATALYLVNTAAGLSAKGAEIYQEVKYEELVDTPEKILKDIGSSLGFNFEAEMLAPSDEKVKIEGWAYSESDKIRKGSIGRFEKDHVGKKEQIINAVASLKISDSFCTIHQLQISTIEQICEELNYPFIQGNGKFKKILNNQRFVEQWNRLVKGYPYNFSNYPIELS